MFMHLTYVNFDVISLIFYTPKSLKFIPRMFNYKHHYRRSPLLYEIQVKFYNEEVTIRQSEEGIKADIGMMQICS